MGWIGHLRDYKPLACGFCLSRDAPRKMFLLYFHNLWSLLHELRNYSQQYRQVFGIGKTRYSLCLFIFYAYIWTCRKWHFNEIVPLGIITWSVLGKRNVQAKELYFNNNNNKKWHWPTNQFVFFFEFLNWWTAKQKIWTYLKVPPRKQVLNKEQLTVIFINRLLLRTHALK